MPKQAKDLAAFLSDWSKNSVLIKAVAAAEEIDDSSQQSRQRSHSQPPPATLHLPTGGTFLRRRNSYTMNRGSNNSDYSNQNDTIDSVMTTRRQRRSPSHSLQNPNLSNHNYQPQIIEDDDTAFSSSPLCTLALVDERLNISRRFREAGAGVGGFLPPLPLSLLETRSNDNDDTQQSSSIPSPNHIVLSNPSTGMDSNHSDIDEEPNSARSNAHSDGQEHDGNDYDRAS